MWIYDSRFLFRRQFLINSNSQFILCVSDEEEEGSSDLSAFATKET